MTTLTTDGATVVIPSFTTFHNLGPLPPTSFPSNCLTDFWDMQTVGLGYPSQWSYHTQGCATSTCCPYQKFFTEGWAWMTSYYSPGVCPSQYRSCQPPDGPTALSSASGETLAFCCPTNYACPTPPLYGFCQSVFAGTTTATLMDNLFDQSVISVETWSVPSSAYYYQAVYPIQVRSRAGDTFILSSSGTTSTFMLSTNSGGPTSMASTATGSSSSSATSHSTLSAGAIAGIAVGGFCGLAILVLGVLLFLYKSRQLRNRPVTPAAIAPPTGPPVESQVGGDQKSNAYEKVELPVTGSRGPYPRHELP